MNRLRVLFLTALILMLASRLPGQRTPAKDIYVQPVVCNDGTISFFVARAYLHVWFGKDPWVIQGWYEVGPGKCEKIGPEGQHYSSSGIKIFGGIDGVTLLAFAFWDSKGAWTAVKVPVGDAAFEPSNQQFCVKDHDVFLYSRDSEQSDLPRQCDRAPAGYHLISASVAFYGYSYRPSDPGPRDYLHVSLGPSPGSSNTPAPKPSGDSGDSVGTQLLKALEKAAAVAPPGRLSHFVDGCNAFYRDPANARLSMSDATGWCACLSEQYRNLMTPEEESKYANDFGRLFHGGIAQPWGYGLSKSDPAWPRLHPAVDKCAR